MKLVERIFDLPDGELRVVSLRGGDPRNTASAFLYATARKMQLENNMFSCAVREKRSFAIVIVKESFSDSDRYSEGNP